MACGVAERARVTFSASWRLRLQPARSGRRVSAERPRPPWSESLPPSPASASTAPSASGRSSCCAVAGFAPRGPPSVSITASTEPIGIWSPTSPASFDHLARDRAFHLDRRLVGHHVGELLVLGDRVADLDVPGDDLRLGNAFADVGQLEFVIAPSVRHHFLKRASSCASGPGNRPIRRRAGRACPSRSRARPALRDDRSSAPAPARRARRRSRRCAALRGRSRQRPVFSTDASMVSMSSGTRVRRSMTSASMPCSSTAASATWTIVP